MLLNDMLTRHKRCCIKKVPQLNAYMDTIFGGNTEDSARGWVLFCNILYPGILRDTADINFLVQAIPAIGSYIRFQGAAGNGGGCKDQDQVATLSHQP